MWQFEAFLVNIHLVKPHSRPKALDFILLALRVTLRLQEDKPSTHQNVRWMLVL